MFVISDANDVSSLFHDAMSAFKATWLCHHLPAPFDDGMAILLPRNEWRSMRVAGAFRHAGLVDLGQHLSGLLVAQELHRRSGL